MEGTARRRRCPEHGAIKPSTGRDPPKGNDLRNPEWKYIPVRRRFVLLGKSIVPGIQRAVFEPNDERTYVNAPQPGCSCSDRGGRAAWQGSTPHQAYFVKCDRETMTQHDIDNGRVIFHVGYAPLRPAEFVIIQVRQKTAAP